MIMKFFQYLTAVVLADGYKALLYYRKVNIFISDCLILQTGTSTYHGGSFGLKVVDNDNGVLLNLSSGNN